MPTISMFYGIIISLYFYDDERHKLPHIHAKYQGQDASFSIIDSSVLAGEIPVTKVRLVQAGLKFIESRFWQIGNLLSVGKHHLRLTLYARRVYGVRY